MTLILIVLACYSFHTKTMNSLEQVAPGPETGEFYVLNKQSYYQKECPGTSGYCERAWTLQRIEGQVLRCFVEEGQTTCTVVLTDVGVEEAETLQTTNDRYGR